MIQDSEIRFSVFISTHIHAYACIDLLGTASCACDCLCQDIIARALHGHLLVCFEVFVMRRENTESQSCFFKENINEQLSITDSTATDDIVHIS